MSQTEISREYWRTFCSEFTREHHSWIVNLSIGNIKCAAETKVEEAEQSMQSLVRMAAFQAIVADSHNGDYTISIVVGIPPEKATHFIYDPAHLFFHQNVDGAHEGLIIESKSGQNTLLRFRVAALPETLDGIIEADLISNR